MEAGQVMLIFMFLLVMVAVIACTTIKRLLSDEKKPSPVGTLQIYTDEDGTYFFLELGVPVEEIKHRKTATLKVNNNISHK